MKRIDLGMIATALATLIIVTGCGTNTKVIETPIDEPVEMPVPNNGSIAVGGNDNTVVTRTNSGVYIDCGDGGCGDVSLNLPEEEEEIIEEL